MSNFLVALENNELSIACQPIRLISAPSDRADDYFEVLLRVNGASPATFLDRLSVSDCFKLDLWIADQVSNLPRSHRYAINLSPSSFYNRVLVEKLLNSQHDLVLEITEHHAVTLAQKDLLTEICRQFPVLVDDVGAAYSGLNRMLDFNFKGIKIDGHLVKQVQESFKARAIVNGLMRMAQDLGISCVCECVESIEVWELLKKMHAEQAPRLKLYVQGWVVGVPGKCAIAETV